MPMLSREAWRDKLQLLWSHQYLSTLKFLVRKPSAASYKQRSERTGRVHSSYISHQTLYLAKHILNVYSELARTKLSTH